MRAVGWEELDEEEQEEENNGEEQTMGGEAGAVEMTENPILNSKK